MNRVCSIFAQLLRVKTFVGTSANALKFQIWTALIAMPVLKYLQLKSMLGWSLSNLVALVRQQLLFIATCTFGWMHYSKHHRCWRGCMMGS